MLPGIVVTLKSWDNKYSEIKEIPSEKILWKYEGDWKADKKVGHGVLHFKKVTYDGNTHGHVTFNNLNTGSWVDDMRDGHGTLIDEMGTYIGEWKQDQVFPLGTSIS